jgi:DnaK suppressor protein
VKAKVKPTRTTKPKTKVKTTKIAKIKIAKAKSKAKVKVAEKSKTNMRIKPTVKRKDTTKAKGVTKKTSVIKTPAVSKPKATKKAPVGSKKVTKKLGPKAKVVGKAKLKAKVSTKKDATPKKTVEVKQKAPRPPPSTPRSRNVSTEPTVTPYRTRINEEYMNQVQRAHFSEILLQWKMQLMEEVDRTVSHMKDEAANYPDPADRASQEEEFSLELKTRDRERKLIRKIDKTIELIDQDEYGYCESCGIEIGVQRLEARPTATQCIDCKTLDEIKERQIHG